MNIHRKRQKDKGFTLVEILVAIVVVGILAAVAIIGIASLTDSGNKSACTASADAAKAAATVHFANNQAYPSTMKQLVDDNELELPEGVTVASNSTAGASWTLTMTPGSGGNPPTFACS